MIFGLPFATFRATILTLVLLSQIYLFLRARRAIRSSRRSDRFKSRAVGVAGAAICLLFAANLCILFRPIPWGDPPAAAQILLFYPPAVWNLGSLFSALLLFLAQIAGFLARQTVHLARRVAGRSAPPVDPGRRRLLQAGAGGLFAVPLLLSGYGASYVERRGDIQELTLPFGCPLRVVQLTDIHAGIFMNRRQMRYYVDRVISLQPDLFVLTGDYVSNSLSFLPDCLEEMAQVRTRYVEGLFRIGTARMYVSRGIGTTFTPVRLNAPPEITLFHLT